jgi:hypothetical protein
MTGIPINELESIPPMKPHRIRYIRNDKVYECMRYQEVDLEEYEGIVIVAREPEEWESFVFEQKFIDSEWNKRKMLTESDVKLLSSCGIAWGEAASWKEEEGVPMWSMRGEEH